MAGEPLITSLGCLTLHNRDSKEQKQKNRESQEIHLSEGDLLWVALINNFVVINRANGKLSEKIRGNLSYSSA